MAQHHTPKPKVNLYGVNAIAKVVRQAVLTAAMLFLGAGTLDWAWGWVCVIVTTACWIGLSIALVVGNPELLNARGQRIKQVTVGTKKWDLALVVMYLVLSIAQPFVAGLDWRNAWSTAGSPIVYVLGNILMILGFALLAWAMIANRYFEPSVRLQESRGHRVETGGPYRFVRHPGYVGLVLQFLALPLSVGMWTAFIPGAMGIAVFVIRTALEDRTLRQELDGYEVYTQRVRYRLLPGVW